MGHEWVNIGPSLGSNRGEEPASLREACLIDNSGREVTADTDVRESILW